MFLSYLDLCHLTEFWDASLTVVDRLHSRHVSLAGGPHPSIDSYFLRHSLWSRLQQWRPGLWHSLIQAMALKQQNRITLNIGLSRMGIKCQNYLYLKLKSQFFFGISIWILVLKLLSTLYKPRSLSHVGQTQTYKHLTIT